jgi:hypothetical protein
MDISTIIAALASSGFVSVGGAAWLTKRLVDHRLAKDLKNHEERLNQKLAASKAEMDGRLATSKAEVEAMLRRGVEEYLGEKAADRQYRLEARKRLYAAIGPLRFQLVLACSDFANRISRIGTGQQAYATSLTGYFGRSTVFRFLRIFGLAELIERQTAYADFSVDPSMVNLLRFKHAAFLCLSSSTISLDHPKASWDEQVEHVFHDTLSVIAAAMILSEADGRQRVVRFDEFNGFISSPKKLKTIHPIPRLMQDFSVTSKPILWTRLVALAGLCSGLVDSEGPQLGIVPEPFDGSKLLLASGDDFITVNHRLYCEVLRKIASVAVASPSPVP